MEGKILSTVGGIYNVYSNGNTYNLFSRGSIKHKSFSLCAGDNIVFDEKEGVIVKAIDRKNFLIRPRSANVDLMVITMSVVEPELSPELVYKFLTYANLNNIKAAVLFTKLDRLDDTSKVENLRNDLEKLGYKTFLLSRDKTENIEELQAFFEGKTPCHISATCLIFTA